MSNKTRLETNNASLQTILDKVNALPEAGSVGASVETCTVTVQDEDGLGCMVIYTAIIDGIVTPGEQYKLNGSQVIENVVLGSNVVIRTDAPDATSTIDGGTLLTSSDYMQVLSTNATVVTVTMQAGWS